MLGLLALSAYSDASGPAKSNHIWVPGGNVSRRCEKEVLLYIETAVGLKT